MYKVDRRLYLDELEQRIVTGPPLAATLYKAKGGPVTKEELERWGDQLKQYIPEFQQEVNPEVKIADRFIPHEDEKRRGRPRDKTKYPVENKSIDLEE